MSRTREDIKRLIGWLEVEKKTIETRIAELYDEEERMWKKEQAALAKAFKAELEQP